MKRVIIVTFLLSMTAAISFAQSTSTKDPANILIDWMDFQSKIVRRASGIPHVGYSRHFSYTAIAAYESIVLANPSYRSLAGQLEGLQNLPAGPKGINNSASLNAAYADMLRKFYGNFAGCNPSIDSMELVQQAKLLTAGKTKQVIEKSSAYGKSVAAAIWQWAEKDGANTSKEYKPLTGEGVWTTTGKPAGPFWAENRSLTPKAVSVFSLSAPNYSADSSAMFYKMAKEVYTSSQNLTEKQKTIALYWDDSPNGQYMTVFGHWTCLLSGLLKEKQANLYQAAEAFARMSISLHDASILAWKGKYQYNVVRPVTFIRQYLDKQWNPLIATPPHPEFPAAHATLSTAAALALCSVFGNSCAVTDKSYVDIGMKPRSYKTIQQAAQEAGYSRLYGGIHYRYSIEQGFILGAATANFVTRTLRFH